MGRGCSICRDAFAEMPATTATIELPACRHAFCEECLGGWWSAAAASGSKSCPDCRRVYSGLRRCPRSTAGAVAASEGAAQTQASVASKRQRYVAPRGSDRATVDDAGSGEEEEHEPVPKRRKHSSTKPSSFRGVSWEKTGRKWRARIQGIRHDGKKQHLGLFDDEQEAAQAFDTAARRLRGDDAHKLLAEAARCGRGKGEKATKFPPNSFEIGDHLSTHYREEQPAA